MPEVLMPDQSAPGYPDEFRFPQVIEKYYRALPRTLRRHWDTFGSGVGDGVSLKADVSGVEGTARARMRTYEQAAARLAQRFRDLQDMDRRLADEVRRSMAAARTGREQIGAVINRLNVDAGTVPIATSKGDHILDYVPAGLDRVNRVVVDTTLALQGQAGVIGDLTHRLTEVSAAQEPTSTRSTRFSTASAYGLSPSVGDDRPWTRTNRSGASGESAQRDHRDTSTALPPSASVSSPATGPAVSAMTKSFRPGADAPDPASRGHLSSPMADAAGRSGHDPSTAVGATAPADTRETHHGEQASPPTSTGTTPSATPWTRRTGVVPGHRQFDVISIGKRLEADETGRKNSLPADETETVYVFPDGRTLEVSPAVARVLDAAFGKQPGTADRLEHVVSAATAPSGKPVGLRRTVHSVATGDIAVWARRSAVVVVFGTGNNRSLEVIVDGGLQPFPTPTGDEHDQFGPFTGFHQPARTRPNSDVVGEPAVEGGQRVAPSARTGEQTDGAVTVRAQRNWMPHPARVADSAAVQPTRDGQATVANS